MELFGSVKKSSYTFNKWYLEMPDTWSTSRSFVKNRPFANLPTRTWRGLNPSDFNFFKLTTPIKMNSHKVFDLRNPQWRYKLLVFSQHLLGGNPNWGWTSKGDLSSSTSPLEHVKFMGNYHCFADMGILWVAMLHGPVPKHGYVEVWYYVNSKIDPKSLYSIKQVSYEDL